MLSQSHLSLHTNVQLFYLPLRIFPHILTSCSTVKVHFLLSGFFFFSNGPPPCCTSIASVYDLECKVKSSNNKSCVVQELLDHLYWSKRENKQKTEQEREGHFLLFNHSFNTEDI